jgi:hypothetical protein
MNRNLVKNITAKALTTRETREAIIMSRREVIIIEATETTGAREVSEEVINTGEAIIIAEVISRLTINSNKSAQEAIILREMPILLHHLITTIAAKMQPCQIKSLQMLTTVQILTAAAEIETLRRENMAKNLIIRAIEKSLAKNLIMRAIEKSLAKNLIMRAIEKSMAKNLTTTATERIMFKNLTTTAAEKIMEIIIISHRAAAIIKNRQDPIILAKCTKINLSQETSPSLWKR